jgi:hypothetical protein
MTRSHVSHRNFLKTAVAIAGTSWLRGTRPLYGQMAVQDAMDAKENHTLRIATTPLELSPNRIVSVTTYNGQFPGPLLRMKEGKRVTVDVHNETDVPEQLHWHSQFAGTDVDGAGEEGAPFIAPHGSGRISFIPGPSGLRFYQRCCMDRARAELPTLFPASLRGDVKTADRVWAACIQHSIEDGHSDSRFSLLAREAPRSQAVTDDGLVSAHRGFNQSALAVVSFLLPAQPSMCGNGKNVLVSLRWVVLGLGT